MSNSFGSNPNNIPIAGLQTGSESYAQDRCGHRVGKQPDLSRFANALGRATLDFEQYEPSILGVRMVTKTGTQVNPRYGAIGNRISFGSKSITNPATEQLMPVRICPLIESGPIVQLREGEPDIPSTVPRRPSSSLGSFQFTFKKGYRSPIAAPAWFAGEHLDRLFKGMPEESWPAWYKNWKAFVYSVPTCGFDPIRRQLTIFNMTKLHRQAHWIKIALGGESPPDTMKPFFVILVCAIKEIAEILANDDEHFYPKLETIVYKAVEVIHRKGMAKCLPFRLN